MSIFICLELLKWFVFLVSRCSVVGCEIEAAYMWGLLHPALLSGEASYYLTAFSSATHVLKHIDLLPKLQDYSSLSSEVIHNKKLCKLFSVNSFYIVLDFRNG